MPPLPLAAPHIALATHSAETSEVSLMMQDAKAISPRPQRIPSSGNPANYSLPGRDGLLGAEPSRSDDGARPSRTHG